MMLVLGLLTLLVLWRWRDYPDQTFTLCVIGVLVSVCFISVQAVMFQETFVDNGKENSTHDSVVDTKVRSRQERVPVAPKANDWNVDPVLGGTAQVIVLQPSLEIVNEEIHICEGESAELHFVLRGDYEGFRDWSIVFFNEDTNATFDLQHVRVHAKADGLATFSYRVTEPGTYKFRKVGNRGMECSVIRLKGKAVVVQHSLPSLRILRDGCEGDAFVVVGSDHAPFSINYKDGDGVLHTLSSSLSSTFTIQNVSQYRWFASVKDAFCTRTLDPPLVVGPAVRSEVSISGGTNVGDCIFASLAQKGVAPIVLSFYRTNVTKQHELSGLPPARQEESLSIELYDAENMDWKVEHVENTSPGASDWQRPPGWLSEPSSAVNVPTEELAFLLDAIPFCRNARLIGQREWKSFRMFEASCASGDFASIIAFKSCSGTWKIIKATHPSNNVSLKRTEPLMCFSSESDGILDEEDVSGEVNAMSVQVSAVVGAYLGREFPVFGFVSMATCGVDCVVVKAHLGNGEAVFVKLFRAFISCEWEVVAYRVGFHVSDKLVSFNCSNVHAHSSFGHMGQLVEKSLSHTPNPNLVAELTSLLVSDKYFAKCAGSATTFESIAQLSGEAHVAFMRLSSASNEAHVVIRCERRAGKWMAVGSLKIGSSDRMSYFYTSRDTQCDLPTRNNNETDLSSLVNDLPFWDLQLQRLKKEIESRTGNRYDCLRASDTKMLGSGLVRVSAYSQSLADCQNAAFFAPTSVSELVSVTLDEQLPSTCVVITEPNMCYSFGSVRDRDCEGICTLVEICPTSKVEVFTTRQPPTCHISGGGTNLKPGSTAPIYLHASGIGPFVVELSRDGMYFTNVTFMSHIFSMTTSFGGLYKISKFRDNSESTDGVTSGEALVTIREIALARLRQLPSPCPGGRLRFIAEVFDPGNEMDAHRIKWQDAAGVIHEVSVPGGTKTVELHSQLVGVVRLVHAQNEKSGELLDVDKSVVNLSFRDVGTISLLPQTTQVCQGVRDVSMVVQVDGGGKLPCDVVLAKDGSEVTKKTISSVQSVVYLSSGPGLYTITKATDDFGCALSIIDSSISITSLQKPCCDLAVPSGKIYYIGQEVELICRSGQAPWSVAISRAATWDTFTATSSVSKIPLARAGRHVFATVGDGSRCEGSVGDKNRPCEGPAFVEVFERPNVFVTVPPQRPCHGQSLNVMFRMQGAGPWRVLLRRDNATLHELHVSDIVSVHDLGAVGHYSVVQVTDAHNETNSDIQIQFRLDSYSVPQALFSSANDLCFFPNMTNSSLTIGLSGTPPFRFSIQHPNGTVQEHSEIHNSSYVFPIESHGTYEILSVNDAHCQSTERSALTVREMPKAEVAGGAVLCDGDETKVEFRVLGGVPPFQIVYHDAAGEQKAQAVGRNRTFVLTTGDSGIYFIQSLSDRYCSWSRTDRHRE